MIADSQNNALLIVGNAALERGWKDYAEYCFLREKGFRKEAFIYLNNFLTQLRLWSFDEEINFIKFLFTLFESVRDADYGPFPYQIKEWAQPILQKWCEVDLTNSEPHRWYGRYYFDQNYIEKALEINPSDVVARYILVCWLDDSIYSDLDYLPYGYHGDTKSDLERIEKIKSYILGLPNGGNREEIEREIEKAEILILNYAEWKSSGHPNLEQWGIENNKAVGYKDFD